MSLFLAAANPRDRKLLRDHAPIETSSDSDSDSNPDSEAASQPSKARSNSEGGGSTELVEPRQTARQKRARSPSPSSQDSASPPPTSKRRIGAAISQQLPVAVSPSSQKALPRKRLGRPPKVVGQACRPGARAKLAGLQSPSTQPPAGSARQEYTAARPATAATGQDGLSRAARLARRTHESSRDQRLSRRHQRQHASVTAGMQERKPLKAQQAAKLQQADKVFGDQPQARYREQSDETPRLAAQREHRAPVVKPAARAQVVQSPFGFASQAFRSAAQLLSLRPRKVQVPASAHGTRGQALRSMS